MVTNSLDTKLRALATDGELTYLSICPVAGKEGVVFAASYSPASFGGSTARDADPVKACLAAIENYEGMHRTKRVTKKTLPEKEATAAVDEFGL